MQSEPIAKTPEEIKKELSKPFPLSDIEWRIQSTGVIKSGDKKGEPWARCLAYVTNRAIMERLDEVLGIDGWQNEFKPLDKGGNLCGISIKFGDEWVTKWDGAENTDIEAVKGGISGAMKRAAVQWGIGRYLYNLEAGWATIMPKGQGEFRNGKYMKDKKPVYFEWNPPALPKWALPEGEEPKPEPERKPEPEPEPEKKPAKISFEDFINLEVERIGAKRFIEVLGREGYDGIGDLMEKMANIEDEEERRKKQKEFFEMISKEPEKENKDGK